mgnify:CR=1 FL=1
MQTDADPLRTGQHYEAAISASIDKIFKRKKAGNPPA